MATYLQLAAEEVWRAQYPPDGIGEFVDALAARGITAYIGGDNNHLTGRHRSMRWCKESRYCTNRSYGTVDGRDTAGAPDAYRATDVMIEGDRLESVCRRLDDAVRAGQLPGLAEWFGTFDSQTVVGWYEGHPSSSDDSHLTHLHLGYWTTEVNNSALFADLLAIIDDRPLHGTSEDDMDYIEEKATGTVYACPAGVVEGKRPAIPLTASQWNGGAHMAGGGKLSKVDKLDLGVFVALPVNASWPPAGGGGGGGLVPHTHETGPAKPTA